jgi:predicted nucleic acid-binding protein
LATLKSRARDVLLDTGPLLAILAVNDQWHTRCLPLWYELAERCLTTEAVVTEATHLVSRGGAAPHIPLNFLVAAGVPIVGIETAGHVHAARLMRRYHDVPMDYADATLVVLGDALGLGSVFTTDRRGFTAYRRATGARFRIVPGD